MTPADTAIRELLRARGTGKTICPSEAAREMAGPDGDWRARMDNVHDAVRQLAESGEIALSWKGAPKAAPDGPYRIRLAR